LSKFQPLFSGKLGCYPHKQVHLELLPNAKPQRPYAVPHSQKQVFKNALDQLVEIGILS